MKMPQNGAELAVEFAEFYNKYRDKMSQPDFMEIVMFSMMVITAESIGVDNCKKYMGKLYNDLDKTLVNVYSEDSNG